MLKPSNGTLRLYKPKNDTTVIKARITKLEKSQFETFCAEYNIKLSDLLRLGARFIMENPKILNKSNN